MTRNHTSMFTRSSRVLVPALTLWLAGCASNHGIGKLFAPDDFGARSESHSVDKLAEFVGAAPFGKVEQYSDPTNDDPMTIRVIHSYAAATGNMCRQFAILDPGSTPSTRLVCKSERGWSEIPPLVPNSNTVR